MPLVSLFSGPFWFLRHGESTANRTGFIAGNLDCPLTENGRRQAREAGDKLAKYAIQNIVTSRLCRAHETALIVANRVGAPIVMVEDVGERRWGNLEGTLLSERADYFADPPRGESWPVFCARNSAALDAIDARRPTLVIAHAGTWRVICVRLGFAPGANAIANAAPILVEPGLSHPQWSYIGEG
ncbi:MAG: histidine phosphatase family protein [Alphaproteobacteria bacterium]